MKYQQIVCNTCVGGRIYDNLKNQYKTPFIWNIIQFKYYMFLMNNIRKIDFLNYECNTNNNKKYVQVVLDNIKLDFIHYIEKDGYEQPKFIHSKNQSDIYCTNIIDKYFKTKYENRCKRMNNNDDYIFILDSTINKNHDILTSDNIREFMDFKPYNNDRKILITVDNSLKSSPYCGVVYTNTGNTVQNGIRVIKTYKSLFN